MTLNIINDPSPNFGPRNDGKQPVYLVLHYTGTPSLETSLHNLKGGKKGHDVSAHYLVGEDGAIVRLVDEDMRAWHAGKSFWQGETDMNSASIGIEIQNPGHEHGYRPFPETQVQAVIALCRDIMTRRGIPSENVLAHSDIAPERKEDPGELFPWERLAQAGVGVWPRVPPAADTANEQEVRKLLTAIGFDPKADFQKAVVAFQRRYEPEAFKEIDKPAALGAGGLARLRALAAEKPPKP